MKIKLSQFIQVKFNIFLYILIGWSFAKHYIFLLGKLYYFINRDEKSAIVFAVNNVIKELGLKVDPEKTIQNVFNGIIAHYYEKMFIGFAGYRKKNKFIKEKVSCKDLNVLEKSLMKGNGVIFITGHYGAIEYMPALFGLMGFPISMIAKFKTERLKKKILEQAMKYNARFISTGKKNNILINAVKELKQNRVLITQCDEFDEWRPSKNKDVTFLGQKTGVDRTINIIQKRSGAEILFGVIHRHNLKKYELKIFSYEDMLKNLPTHLSTSVAAVIIKTLEQYICKHPEQWYQWQKMAKLTREFKTYSSANNNSKLPYLVPITEKNS